MEFLLDIAKQLGIIFLVVLIMGVVMKWESQAGASTVGYICFFLIVVIFCSGVIYLTHGAGLLWWKYDFLPALGIFV